MVIVVTFDHNLVNSNSFFPDLDNVWFSYDQALISDVCDETEIAELKLKVPSSLLFSASIKFKIQFKYN
jgi:hypothetical protein